MKVGFASAALLALAAAGAAWADESVNISLGTEYAMDDNWLFKAEYTYLDIGHGSNVTTNCAGDPATCAAFNNVSLDSIHNNFTASVFRIGFNYRFGAPVVAAAMVAAPVAARATLPVRSSLRLTPRS